MSEITEFEARAGAALAALQVKAIQLTELINGVKDAKDAALPSVVDVVRTSIHDLSEAYFSYAHHAWRAGVDRESQGE
jgi:hypothetical protein